jgi:phosphatidylinositol alpha-mannosyltransferase
MKIAQVTEFYAPWAGGIGEHVTHLSRELRARGHDVRILTGRHRLPGKGAPIDPDLERKTYRLGGGIRFPYNGGMASVTYGLGVKRRLDEILEREGFDIVHIHNPLTPVLPILALDRSPAATVGTFHSYHDTQRMLRWWHGVLEPRMRRLQLAVAVSPAASAAFDRYFPARYEIVPNGIDLRTFAPNGHVPAADGEQSLLFVGQLVPKKGLPTLLEAFERLLDEFPRLRLKVVGDGPLREPCRGLMGERARARVEFLGQQHGEPLVELYQSCDVFCAPSIGYESFGITLLEAMAAGKPIVASRIPGYSDVVRDGEEAILHASRDPRDLAAALRRVVTDGELRNRLAAQGRRTVQRYAWPRVAAEIENHYERVLRERC